MTSFVAPAVLIEIWFHETTSNTKKKNAGWSIQHIYSRQYVQDSLGQYIFGSIHPGSQRQRGGKHGPLRTSNLCI